MVNNNAGKVHIGAHTDAVSRLTILINHHVEYFHFICNRLFDEVKRLIFPLKRKAGFVFVGHKVLHKFAELHIGILPSGKKLALVLRIYYTTFDKFLKYINERKTKKAALKGCLIVVFLWFVTS